MRENDTLDKFGGCMARRSSESVDDSLLELSGYLMSLQTALKTMAIRNTSDRELIEQLQSVTSKACDIVARLRSQE